MAGPNPYRLHSFEELRRVMGKSWLVCDWCRRFAPLAGNLKGRDTPTTTFSCSVCGGAAKHVFEDPSKTGLLQFDPRQRPRHHVDRIVELRAKAEMRRRHEERHGKVAREDLPQARRERPKPAPEPRYVLKPFPVRTFGDIAAWGLKADVHCGSCHRPSVPLEVGENLKPLALLGTRLRCTGTLPTLGVPCTGYGQLWVSPADLERVPDAPFLSVLCGNQDHTTLMASYLMLDRPPWQAYLAKGENFSCPQCGRRMGHTWHNTRSRRP